MEKAKKLDWKQAVQFWKNMKKSDKLLLLLAAGIFLVIFSWPSSEDGNTVPEETVPEIRQDFSYESELEARLAAILSGIEDVGTVQVMITLKASEQKVVQMDTDISGKVVNETDSSGGTRYQEERSEDSDTLLVGGSSGEPYVIQEIMPQVEGVIVLADGAGKATVRSDIIDAVEALFSLEAHKIKVFRRD